MGRRLRRRPRSAASFASCWRYSSRNAPIIFGGPLTTESFDASASTRLESMWILLPSTSPASTHWRTVRVNSRSNTASPQRARALDRTLWCGASASGLMSRNQR